MASDYHPIYSTLWGDEKLEGAPFEERGFFAYLCSNPRVRPSGIFRVTDAQLVADTTLPLKKVRHYCADLDRRALIVREEAWMFVQAYFKRQPKGDNLLKGVAADIATCSSDRVLSTFALKYPLLSQRVADRRATVARPINEVVSTEQYSAVAVQSSTVQSNTVSGSSPDVAPLINGHEHGPGHGHGPAAMNTAARDLLAFLNTKAGKHFQPTPINLAMITARLREGATFDQCWAIIGMKTAEWKGDPKMRRYLRPETLFNPTKFASYQGELPATAFQREDGHG